MEYDDVFDTINENIRTESRGVLKAALSLEVQQDVKRVIVDCDVAHVRSSVLEVLRSEPKKPV